MKQAAGNWLLKHVVHEYCTKHMVTLTAYKDNAGGGAIHSLPNNISGKTRAVALQEKAKGIYHLKFENVIPKWWGYHRISRWSWYLVLNMLGNFMYNMYNRKTGSVFLYARQFSFMGTDVTVSLQS